MDQTIAPPVIRHSVAVDFGVIELTGTLQHADAQRSLILLTDEAPERIR